MGPWGYGGCCPPPCCGGVSYAGSGVWIIWIIVIIVILFAICNNRRRDFI